MQHDLRDISSAELAELFRRSVNISTPTDNNIQIPSQPALAESQDVVQEEPLAINYSISQHYTHSAHIAQAIQMEQQTSGSKIIESHPRGLSIYQILAQHNILPSSLVRSQLTLFEQADEDQRARLIQLWSLSPPQRTRNRGQPLAGKAGEYQIGALEQAEDSAFQQRQGNFPEKLFHNETDLKYDHGDYGGWFNGSSLEDVETYMTSGYEQLAQRDYEEQRRQAIPASLSTSAGLIFGDRYNHATDPIYQGLSWHGDHLGQRDVGHHQKHMFDNTNRRYKQTEHVITIQEAEDEEML